MTVASDERTGWLGTPRADTVLSTGTASRIVERAGASLGISVSVTRTSGRVLASTRPDLVGDRLPLAVECLARSHTADITEGEADVSQPLVYDGVVVGAIVLHGEPGHARGIIRVVGALAELLIHQVTVVDRLAQRDRLRDAFLSDLLLGRLPADDLEGMPREAAVLGIDLRIPRLAVAVGIDALVTRTSRADAREAVLPALARTRQLERTREDVVRRALLTSACRPDDVCGFVDEGWFALLVTVEPATLEVERVRLSQRLRLFVEDLVQAGGVDVWAGIGPYYPGWSALARSFADARFAAGTGCELYGPNRAHTIDELGLATLLGDTSHATKSDLAERRLQPLVVEPDLIATLEAYFQHDLSPLATARALAIHRHTLTYRLDKIRRLVGLDPRRFEDAALLHAALLVRRLETGTPRAARCAPDPISQMAKKRSAISHRARARGQ
ncbi:MAG: helix-turn-helix domain-containing protein [Chloroflexi bacterium]|nr:helix-turn-helix domain-containing protein [Chloroflexota bacterium]